MIVKSHMRANYLTIVRNWHVNAILMHNVIVQLSFIIYRVSIAN